MNVKELKELLDNYPDDMEVIQYASSDYNSIDGAEVVSAVDKHFYFMRSHPTMSADNKDREAKFLLLH